MKKRKKYKKRSLATKLRVRKCYAIRKAYKKGLQELQAVEDSLFMGRL
jgi:hypothetical protein